MCVIVDNNNLQIDGEISEVMSVYPIKEKISKALVLKFFEVNGNDIDELITVFKKG